MQSSGVPFNIARIGVDPLTMTVGAMIAVVVVAMMMGVRKDIALGLLVTGALIIALNN